MRFANNCLIRVWNNKRLPEPDRQSLVMIASPAFNRTEWTEIELLGPNSQPNHEDGSDCAVVATTFTMIIKGHQCGVAYRIDDVLINQTDSERTWNLWHSTRKDRELSDQFPFGSTP